MRKLMIAVLPLFLPFAFLVSCKAVAEQPHEQTADSARADLQTAVDKRADAKGTPSNAAVQGAKPGDPLSPLEKDGSAKSSFPAGVVTKLNAIVAQSKDAIDRFDDLRPALETAIATANATPNDKSTAADVTEKTAQLDVLYKQARDARIALAGEGESLLATGQYYDNVIFSGMATFVSKVEDELADEQTDMKALLAKK